MILITLSLKFKNKSKHAKTKETLYFLYTKGCLNILYLKTAGPVELVNELHRKITLQGTYKI